MNLMEDWPGGTDTMFVRDNLLAIGYKYNVKKLLLFIATKNAGSTKPGIAYKASYKLTEARRPPTSDSFCLL